MIPLTQTDAQILIAGTVFILGCLCIILGAFVLIFRSYSSELRVLATHTARLGQKGLVEEVTGLVNSASELLAAMNQLSKTASGVGILLIMLGLIMISASYWVVTQVEWTMGI